MLLLTAWIVKLIKKSFLIKGKNFKTYLFIFFFIISDMSRIFSCILYIYLLYLYTVHLCCMLVPGRAQHLIALLLYMTVQKP